MSKYNRIGIIAAMKIEAEKIIASMEDVTEKKVGGLNFHCGRVGEQDVVLSVCGIGKVFAAICTQTMITEFGVDAIVNTGVVGSLSKELHVCGLLLVSDVVQHDMDTSPIGDPVGLISGINKIEISCDTALMNGLREALEQNNEEYTVGRLASGDRFVADNKTKKYITDTFSASACDMEGAAIGQVAYVNGIPFAELKIASDGGDEDAAMSYQEFAPKAANISAENIVKFLSGQRFE